LGSSAATATLREKVVKSFAWLTHHGDLTLTLPFLLIRIIQTSIGLKGARTLQAGFGGIVLAGSEGKSDSSSAITTGVFNGVPDASNYYNPAEDVLPGGTGMSFGNGNAVGTSSGFVQSGLGQAFASGNSGGNSTAKTDLTLLSTNTDNGMAPGDPLTGGGLSGGSLASEGSSQGSASGNGVFGPSLTLAIAAATPAAPPPAPEVVVDESSKNGNAAAAPDTPAAPTAPAFSFDPNGLPTGGGGGGSASGSGATTGFIESPANILYVMGTNDGNTQFFADEAYGNAIGNGFGFGVGTGGGANAGGEQAGGQGGGTAFGEGNFVFELDDVQNAEFDNFGLTNSNGGAGAYVGFNAPSATVFNPYVTPVYGP
jgi:hypothetical protein